MKECRFNDFSIKFIPQNEKQDFVFSKKYDFAIFQEGEFDRALLFDKSKNQLIFEANNYFIELGNCKKFIIIENGVELIFLWTSLKGRHEKINMRGGYKQLLDYLVLTFCKKQTRCLYIGNEVSAPLAFWRNGISLDVVSTKEKILDEFLKLTQEQFLPF